MEQPTIFEESFGTELLIRRRSLLPVFLKVYIWIGFVLSALFFIAILIAIGFSVMMPGMYSQNALGYGSIAVFFLVAILFGGILFSNTATLWFEVKWAIRFNWVMGGIWGLVLLLGIFMRTADMGEFIMVGLTIPYWVMIYNIQYQWENEAVSAREMNSKSL